MQVRWLLLVFLAAAGCSLDNPGAPNEPRELNFPIALTLSPAREDGSSRYLLVANANFDSHRSSGSVQTYDLDALEQALGDRRASPGQCVRGVCCIETCSLRGNCPEANASANRCGSSAADISVFHDEVMVDSQMNGLALSLDGARVYLPARSGAGGLQWIDLADGALDCGDGVDVGSDQLGGCTAEFLRVDRSVAGQRGFALPSDPIAVAVLPVRSAPGNYVVLVHRNGSASLFYDGRDQQPPAFLHVLVGIPPDVVTAEVDRRSGLVWLTTGGATLQRQSQNLVAIEVVETSPDPRTAELAIARQLPLIGVDDGYQTFDMVIDEGGAEEGMWVLSRRPEAIISIDFDVRPRVVGAAPIGRVFPVGYGPSRIESFVLRAESGQERRYLLASCYDGRNLWLVDPELGTLATLAGFDGPFAMAVDPVRGRAFVSDFRSSYIWVIDLSHVLAGGSPNVVGRVGSGWAPSVFK